MYFSHDTLDDLMHFVFEELLQRPVGTEATKGEFSEIVGAMLHLKNPRARLSKSRGRGRVFSAMGELLWYLTANNNLEFIQYYIPEYEKYAEDGFIFGGYGPRLFRMDGERDQVTNVIELLKRKPSSRKAVIQIFDSNDLVAEHKDIPCTCTLQFLIRDNRMHLVVNMRSNDAFLGLPHDVFAFTMLQEIMARSLGVEVGEYWHSVGSLHLYARNRDESQSYIDEGFQSSLVQMAPMPLGDPWESIKELLKVENVIRIGEEMDFESLPLPSYWLDLARLLKIYAFDKAGDINMAEALVAKLKDSVYGMYLQRKMESFEKKKSKQQ